MSRRPTEKPVKIGSDLDDHGYKFQHPAFGQVRFSRFSGGDGNYYGAEFPGHHGITMEVTLSEHHRSLQNDWYFGKEIVLNVEMTEMQFGQLVSSPNMGSGTPCTIRYMRDGKLQQIPGIEPEPKAEIFTAEIKERMADAVQELQALMDEIDQMGLSNAKAERLKKRAKSAHSLLNSRLPWAEEQFREHMEEAVAAGRANVDGYIAHQLQRLGLDAVQSAQNTLPGATAPAQKLVLKAPKPKED